MPSKELIPPVSREDRACHGTWGTWGSLDFGQEAERSKGWGLGASLGQSPHSGEWQVRAEGTFWN